MSGPNVAVVVLDTLRADAFEDEFDWLSGVRFADAFRDLLADIEGGGRE